MSEKLQPLVSE